MGLPFLGCTDEASDCFVGSRDEPAQVELVFRTETGQIAPAQEGQSVPLVEPPQGGQILAIGARARHLNACGVVLTGSMWDGATALSVERRPVKMVPNGNGWAEPAHPEELQNFANIAACPSAAAEKSIHGERYDVQVNVEDRTGRRAEARIGVIPTCSEPAKLDLCTCFCAPVTGRSCTLRSDGGTARGDGSQDAGETPQASP
ncbi:MAG: hypothetical protein HY698_17145 [Deltaproteobacteria bacterium]|nr:hypothetical protein [Deltaproteobacteria bacterium]